MVVATHISADQYLETTFPWTEPDYVHGEIVERTLPNRIHSWIQGILVGIFLAVEPGGRRILFPHPELRLRLGPDHYRIADVAVFEGSPPVDLIPSEPAFVIVEIVSPDDRFTDLIQRLDDYRQWGVPHVWLVDPWQKQIHVYGANGLTQVPELALPTHNVLITPSELFAGEQVADQ
ncbi:MAG: Uma2 family endonuclease [Bryobacteraceae bacterium]